MTNAPAGPGAIAPADVSVVIQGPVAAWDPTLNALLAALRRHLPGAEIILSTYEGGDPARENYLQLLDLDALVRSPDPGALSHNQLRPVYSNVNRMIVTTSAGLARASRPYALKLRSDARMTGSGALHLQRRFPLRDPADSLFRERVVVSSVFTLRAFTERHPAAFHVSDWFHFGRREDLRDLFDIPLAEEPAYSTHFVRRWRSIDPQVWPYAHGSMNLRYPPETYVTLAWARKHRPIAYADWHDLNPEALDLSHRLIMSNFVVADPVTLGLFVDKPAYRRQLALAHLDYRMTELAYTYASFQDDYRRRFDPAGPVETGVIDAKAARYAWLRRWEMAIDRGAAGPASRWVFRRLKVALRHLTATRL